MHFVILKTVFVDIFINYKNCRRKWERDREYIIKCLSNEAHSKLYNNLTKCNVDEQNKRIYNITNDRYISQIFLQKIIR